MEERRGAYRVFVWSPETKRLTGRTRYRRKDDIEMDLQEMGLRRMEWIDLAPYRDR